MGSDTARVAAAACNDGKDQGGADAATSPEGNAASMAKVSAGPASRGAQLPETAVDELVTAVLTASRALVGVSARSLAELEDRVTLTQFRALVVLDSRDGTNLNRLADELDVNASTAMRTIDRLLAAELVTRTENPGNRREVQLDLTRAGRQLVSRVTRRRRAAIARIVTAMPAERRSELVAALHAFADAAGEPAARVTAFGW